MIVALSGPTTLVGLVPREALAQTDPYKQHMENGVKLYNDRNYEAALSEFRAAYDAKPKASPLVNIALGHKALFNYPKAIVDYANTRGADKVMYAGYFPAGLTLERIFSDMPNVPFRDHVWPKFLRENAAATRRRHANRRQRRRKWRCRREARRA